jgi:hypothetical protein
VAEVLSAADVTDLRKVLNEDKRLTLIASLVHVVRAGVRDDVVAMFCKRMAAIHQKGRNHLEALREAHRAESERLLGVLRDVLSAVREATSPAGDGQDRALEAEAEEAAGGQDDPVELEGEPVGVLAGREFVLRDGGDGEPAEQVDEGSLEAGDGVFDRAGASAHLQRGAGEEAAGEGAALQVFEERLAHPGELGQAGRGDPIDLGLGRPVIKIGPPLSTQIGLIERELPPGGGFGIHPREQREEIHERHRSHYARSGPARDAVMAP